MQRVPWWCHHFNSYLWVRQAREEYIVLWELSGKGGRVHHKPVQCTALAARWVMTWGTLFGGAVKAGELVLHKRAPPCISRPASWERQLVLHGFATGLNGNESLIHQPAHSRVLGRL